MSRRSLARRAVLLLLVVGTLGATAVWSDSGCNTVPYSLAYQSPTGDLGWCEGWWYSDCTYCWNSAGGGSTCANNWDTPCISGPAVQTP